ncbi:MAG: hypothetical protein RIG62_15345 [Cyclobacteriaceae bacterium]
MNWKIITTGFTIWISLLVSILMIGRAYNPPLEDQNTSLIKAELAQHPELPTEEALLQANPLLQRVKHLLESRSMIYCRMQDMLRSPTTLYSQEMELERKKCQENIQKLTQKITTLLRRWEAYNEHQSHY